MSHHLLTLFARRGGAILYLLRDQFTTDAGAPLSSPRTAEPGPGTWTIVDTGNRFSIVGARLIGATHGSIATASLTSGATFTRAGGLACAYTLKRITSARENEIGLRTNSANSISFKGAGSGLVAVDGTNGLNDPVVFAQTFADSDRACVIVCRPTAGALYLVDGNLEWASFFNSMATPRAYIELSQTGSSMELDDFRITTLTGNWATDWGIATNRTASPASGATTTMTADGLVEFTWTAATDETLELDVRRVDADNRWIVRCSQAGSTIKLIERNATVETERGSAAATFTNATAYRITAKCVGTSIKTWVQTSAATTAGAAYASATFQQTATGVAVAGFATGTNLAAWPRVVTAPAI